MARRSFSIVAAAVLVSCLAACTGAPRGPGDIRPSWQVRNSPVPVPHPVPRPAPPRPEPSSPSVSATIKVEPAPVPRPVVKQTATADYRQEARTVTVQRGDTVYAISRRHDADVRAIIAANGLKPPYLLHPGERLRLPGARVHVVEKGETSYGISRRYGVDLAVLSKLNNLRPPYTLHVGQRLMLPAAAATPPPVARGPLPPAPARQGFLWPLQGRLISSFGPKAGGLHNDGINIGAGKGAAVKASDAGVVAYAGSDLRAFGNLVLVQHQGGWVTAYAHLDRFAVARGQKVRRGAVIGHVGETGGVTSPQLHFEIRQGRRAVDPRKHLPR